MDPRNHPAMRAIRMQRPAPPIWERPGDGRWNPNNPRPGFFLLRNIIGKNAKWRKIYGRDLPALIYRPCPWVQPEPSMRDGSPHPDDWCQPTERPRPLCAMLNGSPLLVGSAYGERISGVEHIWQWGREISAVQFTEAMRPRPEYDDASLNEIPSLF